MKDTAAHLSRERVCDIYLARVRSAEDVPCIVRCLPLNRCGCLRLLPSELDRIVIDLPLLSCPCPTDIDAGRRTERNWLSSEGRVHDGETV